MIVKPAPVATSNFTATQSTADAAKAAALAMLENTVIDDSAAPVEQGEVKAKAAVEVEPEEGEPVAEVKAEAPKEPAEKPEEKKALPDPLKNSFERLAREKSELRKSEESLKAREAKVARLEMLERLAANGDTIGALSVLGLKHSDHIQQVLDKGEALDEPAPVTKGGDAYEKRIAALEARLADESNKRNHEQMQGKISDFVKGAADKFPNIAADHSLSGDVVKYMLDFTMQTGKPPGETLEESIQMAAEAVEAREEAAMARLLKRRGLTAVKASDSLPVAEPKSAVDPAASELARKSRTLTNSHASAPRAVGSTPAVTVEELRAQALKQLNSLSE